MQYARGNLDQMPAAEVAYQRGADGEGQISLDNRAAIMTAVRAHNSSIDFPKESGCGCSVGGSPGILLLLFVAGVIALSCAATAAADRIRSPRPAQRERVGRGVCAAYDARVADVSVRRGPPCGGR